MKYVSALSRLTNVANSVANYATHYYPTKHSNWDNIKSRSLTLSLHHMHKR
jgi:hypothetical protein